MEENKVNIKLEKHLWPDEKKKRKQKRLMILGVLAAIIVSFATGFLFSKAAQTGENKPIVINKPIANSPSASLDRLNSVVNILRHRWYYSKDMENPSIEMVDNAILGMIEKNGDPYTSYMTPEELKNFEDGINQNFVGIGVQYYQVDGYSIVQRVFRESPAEKAGVMPGDIFWKVNGQSVVDMPTEEISKLVRGKDKSAVVIEFKRENAIVRLNIVRGPIHQTVFSEEMDKIGYVQITSFGLDTGKEVKQVLDEFKSKGITNLIIDVRDNGGGYLSSLNEIASFFLEKSKVILQQEDVQGFVTKSYSTGNVYDNFDGIVLLANEHSASASEVLVAALHDNLGTDVIGVKTYGKGTVQITETLSEGYALKFTTAQWIGPNGEKIHEKGIKPTIEVKLHDVFYEPIPLQEEDKEPFSFKLDEVSSIIQYAQKALDFLGFSPDRMDGYYSVNTQNSLKSFLESKRLPVNLEITSETISYLSAAVQKEWNINRVKHDVQLQKAQEYFK